MTYSLRIPFFAALLLLMLLNSCGGDTFIETPGKDDNTFQYELIQLETDFGDMLIWLYYQTPLHRDNFLKLTNEGFYDGLSFHRVIDGFVIQGGDPLGNGTGGPGYQIDAEIFSELVHKQGAVAAARTNNPQKRSSGSQFYIVEPTNGTPSLDGEYTVFGEVIQGISVVETIADQPTNTADKPEPEVLMTSLKVVKYTAAELQDQFGFAVPF